jgi:hypothetical protein
VRKAFFPLDEILGVKDRHWSEGIAKKALWLSGLVAYEDAAEILREVGQVEISDTSVWRLTQKWGQEIQELESQEQEQAHRMPVAGEMIRRESHSKGRMGLSMDGTLIYIRGEEWKELKVGCVFDVVSLPSVDP